MANKKGFLIVVAVVLAILLGFLIWSDGLRPESGTPAEIDSEENVLPENPIDELDSINLEDLEDEFEDIDIDLENL